MARDLSTEQKIKEAARKVFLKKGYAATRTRDIAEEAGINLALLNYYFRSKEKLFEQIMQESLQIVLSKVFPRLSDPAVSLKEKVPFFVEHYTEMLLEHPELPTFILSELRHDPMHMIKTLGVGTSFDISVLLRQVEEAKASGEMRDLQPWNFLLNLISLTVFPFVARPIVSRLGGMNDEQFEQLVTERKQMITDMIMDYTFTSS